MQLACVPRTQPSARCPPSTLLSHPSHALTSFVRSRSPSSRLSSPRLSAPRTSRLSPPLRSSGRVSRRPETLQGTRQRPQCNSITLTLFYQNLFGRPCGRTDRTRQGSLCPARARAVQPECGKQSQPVDRAVHAAQVLACPWGHPCPHEQQSHSEPPAATLNLPAPAALPPAARVPPLPPLLASEAPAWPAAP
jgi:hypothetical protein